MLLFLRRAPLLLPRAWHLGQCDLDIRAALVVLPLADPLEVDGRPPVPCRAGRHVLRFVEARWTSFEGAAGSLPYRGWPSFSELHISIGKTAVFSLSSLSRNDAAIHNRYSI